MRAQRWILGLFLLFALLWLIAPVEPVDHEISFNAKGLEGDLDLWLQMTEQQFPDIRPGAAKRILWAGEKGARTPLAIVYIHGFSGSAEEIRPVPDEVARTLGANLYFSRLAGHGRRPAAMAEPDAGDWIEDMAEAMAIGRRLGDRVLVIGTSTGATLAAIAATDPRLSPGMAGVVMISPNFRLASPAAMILNLPYARWWAPVLTGQTRSFDAQNPSHAKHWTNSYPTTALFPMAALMREARAQDYTAAKMPLLVIYSPEDQIIDTDAIAPVTAEWGGDVQIEQRHMQTGDDPLAHVIAGDILSPGQTEPVIDLITLWAKGLLAKGP
ncbi:MAG: alpha/beta fold hydrolase [Paracoccaceae bacterium]